ncbi:hypothetical protein PSHT_04379 [Puccinia striiformis]|uniref:Uncharacterized protein n=1 Tax=Puccinia striiformis TaxID=27350 RepID=A0A2S4WD91_9BASI|nr:hypothetical protein PSHT_04379 [Puccinia striiformis]
MRRSLLMPGMKVIDFENNKANEYLGAILIIIAFLNAFIAWYQGHKADAILASFLSMMLPSCKVMGDKVPADLVLFAASDIKVNNSSSAPLKHATYFSSEGFGIVVRTGDHTFIGQIAGMTRGEPDNKSPLAQEIDDFVKIISCIAISTSAHHC